MDKVDIFLCYRRAGAQTAKLFKRYLEKKEYPGRIWYSDEEPYGNYKTDVPKIMEEAECTVLFVDENFTMNFLQPASERDCITALEILQIEQRMQRDSDFRMIPVFLDCKSFSMEAQQTLRTLFNEAGILTEKSVSHFAQSNSIHFNTAIDDEWSMFERLTRVLFSEQYFMQNPVRGNFYFGKRSTMADIVVWDTENGINPCDISFTLTSKGIPLYRRIEKIRCEESHEIQNNQMVSLTGVEVILSDDEERKIITISYQPVEYRLFHKTLRVWNTAGLNLNQKLLTYTSEKGVYEIPNAMGMAFMVITSDKHLVFTKRSSQREVRPGEYDCSIVEGLKPEVLSAKNGSYDICDEQYIEKEIHRAYREEICSDDHDITVMINGIVLDKEYGQWNIIGTVFTEATSEELIRRHAVRNDTFEQIRMECIPYVMESGRKTLQYVEEALQRYLQGKMWGMALAVLYAALRSVGFREKDIDSMDL